MPIKGTRLDRLASCMRLGVQCSVLKIRFYNCMYKSCPLLDKQFWFKEVGLTQIVNIFIYDQICISK